MTLRTLASRTWRRCLDDDALTYSAALAFHGILALFPFLVFVLALVSYLHVPGLFAGLVRWAERSLPPDGARQLTTAILEIERQHRGGVLSAGLIGAVWAASGGVRSAMRVVEQAYDEANGQPMLRRIARSIAYTIGLAVLFLLSGAVLFVGPEVVQEIGARLGLADEAIQLWHLLRWPVAVALLVALASVCYTVVPRGTPVRLLTPGSVLAVVAWLIAAWLLRLYVANIGRLSRIYGSVTAMAVLLLYAWVGATILLVGAEVNAVLERERWWRERGQEDD